MSSMYLHWLKTFELLIQSFIDEVDFGKNTIKPKLVRSLQTGACAVCYGRKHLINISADVKLKRGRANCVKMILECFHIQIVDTSGTGLLCKSCILRLRDAILFRSQVEAMEKLFATVPIEHVTSNTKVCPTGKNSKINTGIPITFDSHKHCVSNVNTISPASNSQIENKDKLQKTSLEVIESDPVQSHDRDFSDHFDQSSDDESISKKMTESKRIEWIDQRQYPECAAYESSLQNFPACHLCEICGKVIRHKFGFRSHMERHADVRYPCSICSKTYANNQSLSQHVKAAHENKKLYSCPHCMERFSGSYGRREHLMTKHGITRGVHTCPHCPRICYSAKKLNLHIKRIHLSVKNFSCSECGNLFFSKSELKNHSLSHSDVRNFECELCSKRFKVKRHLQTHLKIHYNIRDQVCTICGLAFIQWTSLNLHMKSHHKVTFPSKSGQDSRSNINSH